MNKNKTGKIGKKVNIKVTIENFTQTNYGSIMLAFAQSASLKCDHQVIVN